MSLRCSWPACRWKEIGCGPTVRSFRMVRVETRELRLVVGSRKGRPLSAWTSVVSVVETTGLGRGHVWNGVGCLGRAAILRQYRVLGHGSLGMRSDARWGRR